MKRLRPIAKQFVSFYQVVALFGDVYHVPYPRLYLGLLNWFAIFNLDFSVAMRLECLTGYTWHTKLYSTLAIFVLLAAAQLLILLFLEIFGQARGPGWLRKNAAPTIVLVTYGFYPR